MNDLVGELLFTVLDWLPPRDVLRARCVSRRWQTLAEQVIRSRDQRGGPFVALQHESVPAWCTLPLFMNRQRKQIAHPCIARCAGIAYREPLLAPCARAKLFSLTVVDVGYPRVWPRELLTDAALPRVRDVYGLMENLSKTPRLPERAWHRVWWVSVHGTFLEAGDVPAAFPRITCLEVQYYRSRRTPLARDFAHLQCFSLLDSDLAGVSLPSSLRELFLREVYGTPVSDPVEPPLVGTGFWSPVLSTPPRLAAVVHLPALECLHATDVHTVDFGLRTPALKTLVINGSQGPALDVRVLGGLRSATFKNNRRLANLDWLGASLRTLVLINVSVDTMGFLAALAGLSELVLEQVDLDFRLPCDVLRRLKSLSLLKCMFRHIVNVDDIGLLTSLETLALSGVDTLVKIQWISRLRALKMLSLEHVPEQPENVPVRKLGELLAPLQDLRRLTLFDVHLQSLDLATTSIEVLHLNYVRVPAANLVPPAGLTAVDIASCTFLSSVSACLVAAQSLRRLAYSATHALDSDFERLAVLKNLKAVALKVECYDPTLLKDIRADFVQVDSYFGPNKAFPKISAATLRLAIATGADSMTFDFVDASMLRSLEFVLGIREVLPPLDPLRACKRLEYLRIQCSCSVDLAPLAGHPSLRELDLCCTTHVLDLTPLLTCPKLVAVDLASWHAQPAGYDELMAYLQTQK